MEKVLENSTRTKKIHQFSIEALIGKGDNKTEDKSCPPASSGDVHRPSPKESQLLSQMKSANFRHLFNVSKCNPGNRTATSLTESDYHSILRTWIGHSESSVFQPFKIAATVSSNLTVNNPMFFSPLTLNSFVNRDVLQQSDAWLQARYSHLLNQRYPIGPHPSLYFHPYRKPKRNRTAFSPSQLMDLEESFERNHYVVGQERKQLAFKLQLSETQVKVWFQNRRTKDKRMRGEVDVSVTSQHSDDLADNDTDSETANDQNSEFFPEEDEVATSKFPEAELKQ